MSQPLLNAPKWSDHGLGLGAAAVYMVLLVVTSADVGVPRDESFYFYGADRAAEWYAGLVDSDVRSFSRAEIDRGFKYNHEHPVLMKSLFGLSHRLFVDVLGWTDEHALAYRLPTMAMASLALWLAFLLGVMVHSRLAGLFAVLALAFMPRVFFHAHLACFDAPVTFMWVAIAYAYLRAMRSRRWAIVTGVALGLGFATKLNIFFLPFTLLGVSLFDVWQFKRRTGAWRAPDGERGPLTYHTCIGLSMIFIGAFVFWAHWPWLYYDLVPRLREYVTFHARHVHYPVDYLGFLYFKPPFPVHFPFVFMVLTVPVGILVTGAVGLAVIARRGLADWRDVSPSAPDRRVVDVFLLANLAAPIVVIALPYTPIFGGTKHWMPAMPFLAVLAGVGVVRIGRGLFVSSTGAALRLRTALLGAAMFAPAVWATAEYGAHGPAYYNGLAGGPPGAAEMGMPRNFWGYSTVAVLPAVNEQVEKRGYVFWHKATKWAIDAYQRDGLLRKDVRYTGDWTAEFSDWAVYHDQREKLPEELDVWRAYGTMLPVEGHYIDGVQIMAVYHRPSPPEKPLIPAGGR